MSKAIKPSEVGTNPLCGQCLRHCKQSEGTIMVDCPRFLKRPFKVATYRYDQLDLFTGEKK